MMQNYSVKFIEYYKTSTNMNKNTAQIKNLFVVRFYLASILRLYKSLSR